MAQSRPFCKQKADASKIRPLGIPYSGLFLAGLRFFVQFPFHPQRAGNTDCAVNTGDHANDERERKCKDTVQPEHHRHDAYSTQRQQRGNGRIDGAAQALIDAAVHKRGKIHRITVQLAVLTHTVINNDCIIDGITQDREQCPQ